MARRIDWLSYAMLGMTMVLWAGNSIVGRAVRADIDPVSLALFRWIGATMLIAPFAWRGLAGDLPALRAAWKPVLVLCLVGVAGFNTLLYSGLQYTSATNALLMQAMIPGMVLILGLLFFGQREPKWKVIGIAISVLGAAFTIFRGSIGVVLAFDLGKGDVLVVLSCVCWAIYTVLLRLAPAVRPASFIFVTFLGGALFLLPLAAVMPGHKVALTTASAAGVAYTAIFPSVIAYVLFNSAVRRAGAAVAGQAIVLMPILGAILAALLLDEPLHWYHGVGIVAVLTGVVVAARANREPAPAPNPASALQ